MKKINKKRIILVILILLVTLISFIGGGSFSKYISQVDGNGVFEVARWAFSVNGQTESIGTINLLKTANPETVTQGKIAPGTIGSFDITVDASGAQVGIDYDISFPREEKGPQNIVYSANGHTSKTLVGLQPYLKGTINADDPQRTRTITITWEWPFEPNTSNQAEITTSDNKDTVDGQNLTQFEFDIVVSGKQVDTGM